MAQIHQFGEIEFLKDVLSRPPNYNTNSCDTRSEKKHMILCVMYDISHKKLFDMYFG